MSDQIMLIQFIMGVFLPLVLAWIFNHKLKRCSDAHCLNLYHTRTLSKALQPGRLGSALETRY